ELQQSQPVPLAGRPAGVAFVEPERDAAPDRLVQSQMGQLMPEDPLERFAVGTKDDGAALGQRDRRRPGGRAAAGKGVESASVGNHDKAEGIDGAEPKTGPLAGSGGLARQLGGELQ